MTGGVIRENNCDHGDHCIMPECKPVVLMLHIDSEKDREFLLKILNDVRPLMRAPLNGIPTDDGERKELVDNIMNTIIVFQILRAQEKMDQGEAPPEAGPIDQTPDPFTDAFSYLDLDTGSFSDKS